MSSLFSPFDPAALRARAEAAIAGALAADAVTPARLQAGMRYASEGGKRLRALLVYAAGMAAGAELQHLDAPAVAVELIHAYSLVHDDLPAMDNDDLRRGRATVHKAFDEALAILAGDALQTRAFEILTHEQFPAPSVQARLAWVRVLAAATGGMGMTGGQALDLEAEHQELRLAELQHLHRLKTGALIAAALAMGLAAGKADTHLQGCVTRFGEALGLAYQIQDDILDVEGTAASLGKTPGKDQAAMKSTYVQLLGLTEAKRSAEAQFSLAAAALDGLGAEAFGLKLLLSRIAQRSA